MSFDNKKEFFYYRLRVNINGFRFEDIKVTVENELDDRIRLKISASRHQSKSSNVKCSEIANEEYVKYFDIFSRSKVLSKSMRTYLDPKSEMCLIVEFESNSDENVFINLDDSCESMVETAAKSLLNIKNIEELSEFIKRPNETNIINDEKMSEIFTPSLIKELSTATRNSFTPVRIVHNSDGSQSVRIKLNLPNSVKSASLVKLNEPSLDHSNHLVIKCEGLNLTLEANTTCENVNSLFTKQLKLPNGTVTDSIKFNIDQNRNLLNLEAPFVYCN